ncbi:MAG: NAD-dependent epimerase/dehydratase family protein [Jatrophihabitans sp.]
MRVFVAGASGVIGVRLVALLVAAGHDVAGMTRTPAKAERLEGMGAEPVICDAFDLAALGEAVASFGTEVVLHELTDLPDDRAHIPEHRAGNARMRRQGTRNLLAATEAAGAPRFIAQSVAWQIPGDGGAAVEEHERAVLDFSGVVIRYGQFYGPGTYFASELPPPPRIHVDDAARRTMPALEQPSGVLVVLEDQPH